jgi:hypothetical protein
VIVSLAAALDTLSSKLSGLGGRGGRGGMGGMISFSLEDPKVALMVLVSCHALHRVETGDADSLASKDTAAGMMFMVSFFVIMTTSREKLNGMIIIQH